MSNEVAPPGQVFVCGACGKRSRDLYGDQKIDPWWDESCMLNAVLCYEQKDDDGKYKAVVPQGWRFFLDNKDDDDRW